MLLTNGYASWAVDLKDVGAIYPFQGYEWALVVAAYVFWLLWHITQLAQEGQEIHEKSDHVDVAKAKASIDQY